MEEKSRFRRVASKLCVVDFGGCYRNDAHVPKRADQHAGAQPGIQ